MSSVHSVEVMHYWVLSYTSKDMKQHFTDLHPPAGARQAAPKLRGKAAVQEKLP